MAPRPTLSFCITTQGPADRARALLELLRPHVDEIVLACDRDGGLDTLDACADLADRRLAYELERSPVWLAGWIIHQCRGDWILRLDDDEVPSAALIEALPELLADRYPAAIYLDRRTVYGSARRYITSFPWSVEYLPRLMRNIPSLWRFEGRLHMPGECLGEVRMSDLAMYHLVHLTSSLAQRQAKREWYTGLVPGLAVEDFSLDDMYVPEEVDALETAPVPSADLPLIDALLNPPAATPADRSVAPVEEATLEEIALYNTDHAVSEGAYRARIEFVAPRSSFPPGVPRYFQVLVQNLGDELWHPADGRPPEFQLAWRWRDLRSGRHLREEGRIGFTETVRPGQQTRLQALVPTPSVAGEYALELDVVHEHVRWFGCTVETPVTINAPERASRKPQRLRRATGRLRDLRG